MNFVSHILLSTLLLASLSSCNDKNVIAPVIIQTEVLDSIFNEKYYGLLPCGDCPGIETRININNDSTLTKTIFYRNKGKTIEKFYGTWKLKDSVFEANFDGSKEFYKIKSGSLIARVGSDQNEVIGKLAKDYLLTLKEKLDINLIPGYYNQSDTLNKNYKTLNIKELKQNDYQLTFSSITPNDTCTFKARGILDLKNEELIFPLKTVKRELEGNIIIMFSDYLLHLITRDLKNEDDLLQLCDSIPLNLKGKYKKIQ